MTPADVAMKMALDEEDEARQVGLPLNEEFQVTPLRLREHRWMLVLAEALIQ